MYQYVKTISDLDFVADPHIKYKAVLQGILNTVDGSVNRFFKFSIPTFQCSNTINRGNDQKTKNLIKFS